MRRRLYAGIAHRRFGRAPLPREVVTPRMGACPRFNETSARPGGLNRTGDNFSRKMSMKKPASAAVAAVLLLSGVSAATAASNMSNRSASAASDTLTLSDAQQKTIWKDVSRHAAAQNAPQDFNAAVGTAIPAGITTYPLPRRATRDVPAVKPYRYAMLQDKVLIVNPSDNKIADVVNK
jgi:hypothetical protein